MRSALAAGAARSALSGDRAEIFGCWIDRVDMDGAVALCERSLRERQGVQHVAVNAAKLVAMRSDAQLREIVNGCELITADGQAVVWAARLLGDPLPCRVAGIDLMHRLFELADAKRLGIYILGAHADVLERAIGRIRVLHPNLRIVGWRDGYFDDSEQQTVVEEIASAAPDMLFVAISSPRKERFIAIHRDALKVPFAMGVGGAIDVVAGVTARAPRWMQRAGMEWLWRLAQEPRRLLRRYLRTNALFIALTARGVLARALRAWPATKSS